MARPKYCEQTVDLPSGFVPGKVGVVTITYGSGEVLPDFFASLDKQTYRNFVLIAVDNQSTDSTIDQLRAYNGCELILFANDQNVGVAAGNNQGIRAAIAAGCEHILFLNNDVAFGADLFQQLLDGLTEHNCEVTTPLIYHHDRPNVAWAAGGYFQPWLGYRCLMFNDGDREKVQSTNARLVQHAPTCCVLVRREVFERVGLMDERYFVYHDDTDWMLRAFRARQQMYCLPGATLLHKVSSLSGAGSDFQIRFATRNRAFMIVKFFGRILSIPYTIAYRFLYLLRFLYRKDDYRMLKLKQASWSEGISISDNWWPR